MRWIESYLNEHVDDLGDEKKTKSFEWNNDEKNEEEDV